MLRRACVLTEAPSQLSETLKINLFSVPPTSSVKSFSAFRRIIKRAEWVNTFLDCKLWCLLEFQVKEFYIQEEWALRVKKAGNPPSANFQASQTSFPKKSRDISRKLPRHSALYQTKSHGRLFESTFKKEIKSFSLSAPASLRKPFEEKAFTFEMPSLRLKQEK